MEGKRLSLGESRFLDIIWSREPVASGTLVELCREKLGWKKSTTYTRLRILIDKGYVKNENSVVTALVSRREVQAQESAYVVEETFAGSLPGFLVSFLAGRKISEQEAAELKRLIDEHLEDALRAAPPARSGGPSGSAVPAADDVHLSEPPALTAATRQQTGEHL